MIEDLHGHVFKVVDYNLLPLDVFIKQPTIHEGEKVSLHRNVLEDGIDPITVIEYNGDFRVCVLTEYYCIVYKVVLVAYKSKNDIRSYGKRNNTNT